MRRVRKSVAQRYYQLLSGHAAIGSFLRGRMSGPQRLETDRCWWCNCGKRQSRHHLFTECRAWAPQIRELWQRVGKDCEWEHPRAPTLRWLWRGDAVGAVVEFLENTRVGSRASAEMARARVDEDRDGEEVPGRRARRTGRARPSLYLSFVLFLCPFETFPFVGPTVHSLYGVCITYTALLTNFIQRHVYLYTQIKLCTHFLIYIHINI